MKPLPCIVHFLKFLPKSEHLISSYKLLENNAYFELTDEVKNAFQTE